MKIVFVGAVESSLGALISICAAGHVPDLVMTVPPHLGKRHSDYVDLTPTAKKYGVPVLYTEQTNAPETLRQIADHKPDLILVIGWSQICGPEFRAIPRIGSIGFHPSALPRPARARRYSVVGADARIQRRVIAFLAGRRCRRRADRGPGQICRRPRNGDRTRIV